MYKSCSLISYDHTIIYDTCYDHTIIYDTCYASTVIFLEIFLWNTFTLYITRQTQLLGETEFGLIA